MKIIREKKEGLTIKGYVEVYTRKVGSQELTLICEGPNLITTVGKTLMAQWLSDVNTATRLAYCGVGDDDTAAAVGDTTLGNEVDRKLVGWKTSSAAVTTIGTVFNAYDANGYTLKEAGLLTAETSGTLFSHFIFGTPIAKDSTMEVVVKWTITVS